MHVCRVEHIYVGFFHVYCEMMTKVMNLDFTNSIITPVMQHNAGQASPSQWIAAQPCRFFPTTSSAPQWIMAQSSSSGRLEGFLQEYISDDFGTYSDGLPRCLRVRGRIWETRGLFSISIRGPSGMAERCLRPWLWGRQKSVCVRAHAVMAAPCLY